MKRRLLYRPEALADLNEAEAYTRRTWGDAQAKRYIAGLVTEIKALRLSALRHPLSDAVYRGLRRKRRAMRPIYYLAFADLVEIVRIMHVQRDPGLHLSGDRRAGKDE
jgi:plasmid stabilization system protein ParE